MTKVRKKGLSIVELVIVIAVIAILFAVLIPTFGGIIDKANLGRDQIAIRDMNTLLAIEKVQKDELTTKDIKNALKNGGFSEDQITPLSKGFDFYWVEDLQMIVLYDENSGSVIFPSDLEVVYPDNGEGWLSLSAIYKDKFILLDDSGLSFSFTKNNEMQVYSNGSEPFLIGTDYVTKNGNSFTLSGMETFGDFEGLNGDYTICDDGYIDKNGVPCAKSEDTWVTYQDPSIENYFIVHNGQVYVSEDGNKINGHFVDVETIVPFVNSWIDEFDSKMEQLNVTYPDVTYPYQFEQHNGTLTIGIILDAMTILNTKEKIQEGYCKIEEGELRYEYWGGTAYDTKESDSVVTHGKWYQGKNKIENGEPINVTSKEKLTIYEINNSTKTKMNTTDVFDDGVYIYEETQTYYYDGVETTNIMFFEDYPLYFETGMTYREWMHKNGCNDIWQSNTGKTYYYFIEERELDKPCEPGYNNPIKGGYETGFIICDQIGYTDSDGNFTREEFFYSYGLIQFKHIDEVPEGQKFVGWKLEGTDLFVAADAKIYAEDIFNLYIPINTGDDPIYVNQDLIPDYIIFTPVFEQIN